MWSADITYVPMRRGFLYLVAILDWYSRYVLAWELSNTLDASFCLSALEGALRQGKPDIFNSDQGAQFTSHAFTSRLANAGIHISWDGRGRALDNVFVERLWRSVKWEEVYLHSYETVADAAQGLQRYFRFYNEERLHQALGYRTPAGVYVARGGEIMRPDHSGPPSPAQESDEPGWGLFCEIFVDTQLTIDALEPLIAGLLDAAVERHGVATTIVGPGYELDVHRNERRLASADSQSQQAHAFVAWPYYLEIDATAEQTRPAQIAVIARLLLGLWEAGLGAVAVCDFEEELPQRGGYNPALSRTEP